MKTTYTLYRNIITWSSKWVVSPRLTENAAERRFLLRPTQISQTTADNGPGLWLFSGDYSFVAKLRGRPHSQIRKTPLTP